MLGELLCIYASCFTLNGVKYLLLLSCFLLLFLLMHLRWIRKISPVCKDKLLVIFGHVPKCEVPFFNGFVTDFSFWLRPRPPWRPTHRVELAEQSEDPLHAAEAGPLARRARVVAGVDPGLGRRVEAGQAAALLQHALVRRLEQAVRHLFRREWSQLGNPEVNFLNVISASFFLNWQTFSFAAHFLLPAWPGESAQSSKSEIFDWIGKHLGLTNWPLSPLPWISI